MISILSILLALGVLPAILVAAPPPSSVITAPRHLERREVNSYASKYKKNCGGTFEKGILETEAWNTAQTLAKAAQKWEKGGTSKQTADFWFGNGSADHYDRIMSLCQ